MQLSLEAENCKSHQGETSTTAREDNSDPGSRVIFVDELEKLRQQAIIAED